MGRRKQSFIVMYTQSAVAVLCVRPWIEKSVVSRCRCFFFKVAFFYCSKVKCAPVMSANVFYNLKGTKKISSATKSSKEIIFKPPLFLPFLLPIHSSLFILSLFYPAINNPLP